MTSITERVLGRNAMHLHLIRSEADINAIAGFAHLMLKKMIAATKNPTSPAARRWLNIAMIAPRLGLISTPAGVKHELSLGRHFHIARVGTKIIGINQFEPRGKEQVHGIITCVSPDYGGKAIGQKLQRAAWAWAIRHDFRGYDASHINPESKKMIAAQQLKRKGKRAMGAHLHIFGDFTAPHEVDSRVSFLPRRATRRRTKPH